MNRKEYVTEVLPGLLQRAKVPASMKYPTGWLAKPVELILLLLYPLMRFRRLDDLKAFWLEDYAPMHWKARVFDNSVMLTSREYRDSLTITFSGKYVLFSYSQRNILQGLDLSIMPMPDDKHTVRLFELLMTDVLLLIAPDISAKDVYDMCLFISGGFTVAMENS